MVDQNKLFDIKTKYQFYISSNNVVKLFITKLIETQKKLVGLKT